jgi:hypothetical protein
MSMVDDAVYDVPEPFRERFEGLLAAPAESWSALRGELLRYLVTVQQVGALMKNIDTVTADRLARVALEMLVGEPADDDHRRLVQAAVVYLIREDEDEEITGVLGFEDDLQVLNAAARALGRLDLVSALPANLGD